MIKIPHGVTLAAKPHNSDKTFVYAKHAISVEIVSLSKIIIIVHRDKMHLREGAA